MIGGPEQRWRVQGCDVGEHAAFVPSDLRFTMYTNVVRDMKIRPPFTFFQRSVLRYLCVAPSQLHPNSWAFIKVFERLMRFLDRPSSLHVFFKLFELSRSPEKNSNKTRWSHLSLKGARFYKLFKPYSDSLKPWKHSFAWVVPVCDEACRSVCRLNERGDIMAMLFPLAWTYAHYRRGPANYRTQRPLSGEDLETLRLVENLASWVKNGQLKCYDLVRARTDDEFRCCLGKMAGMSYEELMRKARESKKSVGSPLTPAPSQRAVTEANPPVGSSAGISAKRDRPSGKAVETDPPKRPKVVKDREPSKRIPTQLDLEHLTDSDVERLKADPLLFAAEIARAGSRLIARMKQGEEERNAGILLSAKNLWLEGDNLDKTDKLTRAYDHISELRRELEAAKKKAKEAETALRPTTEALEKAQASLKSVEKERDTAVTRLSKAEEDLRLEQVKVAGLDKKLIASGERASAAETQWHNLEGDFDRLIQSTVNLCEERFQEAIRQVRYVYPTYEINEEIIKADHTLVDGRIVKPEQKDPAGNVVQEGIVIYERLE